MAQFLVLLGLLIVGIGVAMMAGLPLGRLPGDFVIRRGGFTLYLPITTCIVISVLLTVVGMFLRR